MLSNFCLFGASYWQNSHVKDSSSSVLSSDWEGLKNVFSESSTSSSLVSGSSTLTSGSSSLTSGSSSLTSGSSSCKSCFVEPGSHSYYSFSSKSFKVRNNLGTKRINLT